MATDSHDDITIYLVGNDRRFAVRIDKTITLRNFTRVIQDNSTFGISKANMRLNILNDDDTWIMFFILDQRKWNGYNSMVYDSPVSDLGFVDGTTLQVEWVFSKKDKTKMACAAVAAAWQGMIQTGDADYTAGYVFGTVAQKAIMRTAESKARVIALAPDIPPEVLEIRDVSSALGLTIGG